MSRPMYVWNGSTWEEVGPVVPQTPIAYQASAPVSPSTGDIWVDSDGDVGTFDRQLVRYRFVASGGETSLSGVDANGFTLAYVPGAEQVYLNGVLLVRTSDYTATNGTSITALSPALAANDVVEVFAYNSFNLANTYTKAEIDGGFTTIAQNGLVHINTTTFTGVASQSVNDVFSSTYSNYKILVKAACSAATQLSLRMRVSGSDLSSASYMYGGIYVLYNGSTSVTGENANGTPGGASSAGFNILDVDGNYGYARIEMFDPFATEQTGVIYDQAFNSGGSRNTGYYEAFSGLTTVTTSYTGFTLLPASGNITGVVSVYGYKK